MRLAGFLFVLLAAGIPTGCAETSPPPGTASSGAISLPAQTDASDNPPPTWSGYVESSYTSQIK